MEFRELHPSADHFQGVSRGSHLPDRSISLPVEEGGIVRESNAKLRGEPSFFEKVIDDTWAAGKEAFDYVAPDNVLPGMSNIVLIIGGIALISLIT